MNIESKLAGDQAKNIFGLEDPLKGANDAFDAYKAARLELGRLGSDLSGGQIQTGLEKVYNPEFSILGGLASLAKTFLTPELEPVFESLQQRFGQIFDPTTFEINPAILAEYDALDDKTKQLVDNWQETKALMEEAEEQMFFYT